MIKKKIKIGKSLIEGYLLKLCAKNLIILKGSRGYLICGYLNMNTANRFKDVAVKVTGVSSIEDCLKTKVVGCSREAKKLGIRKGQAVKEALKIIA